MRHSYIHHCVSADTFRRPFRSILLAVVLLFPFGMTGAAFGQAAGQDLASANLSDPDRQREMLDWLDKYITDSDLMPADGVAQIRAAVAQMTPSQLERWLLQTKQLREYVESPQWQDTKKWLRGYLKVQAVYSDKEVQEFREKLFSADAEQMLAMMQKIQAKHESMVWMRQASDKSRQMDVQSRNASVARQDSANNAARTAASRAIPLFGDSGGMAKGSKPNSGYSVPGPLVDSRTVAQMAVWRGMW